MLSNTRTAWIARFLTFLVILVVIVVATSH